MFARLCMVLICRPARSFHYNARKKRHSSVGGHLREECNREKEKETAKKKKKEEKKIKKIMMMEKESGVEGNGE